MVPHALESYWLVEAYVALVGRVALFYKWEHLGRIGEVSEQINLTMKG
jgi:hypothetical protein